MEEYQINIVHYRVEKALETLGMKKHMTFVETRGDIVMVTIFFVREHSKHPEASHRIDIWCTPRATIDEIAGIMLEAFEEEWEFSKEHGFD